MINRPARTISYTAIGSAITIVVGGIDHRLVQDKANDGRYRRGDEDEAFDGSVPVRGDRVRAHGSRRCRGSQKSSVTSSLFSIMPAVVPVATALATVRRRVVPSPQA